MAEQPRVLLALSLGPVQPFIEAARRASDLFVGSSILSHLARQAHATISSGQGTIIYPTLPEDSNDGKRSNIPNKLLASFATVADAKAAATKAEDAVRAEWERLAGLVYKQWLATRLAANSDIWGKQIKHFLEVYWAVLDTAEVDKLLGERQGDDERTDYARAVDAAEGLLAARKQARDFSVLGDEQRGPMSSIGGTLPVLRGEKGDGNERIRDFWKELAAAVKREAVLTYDGSERLDAISTVKRLLPELIRRDLTKEESARRYPGLQAFYQRYPSTSDLAAADLRADILRHYASPNIAATLKQLYNDIQPLRHWEETAEDDIPALPLIADEVSGLDSEARAALLRYDGDLLFPASISGKMLLLDYGIYPGENDPERRQRRATEAAGKIASTARELRQAAGAAGITTTSPYYAVVLMDGDRMGRLLSGMAEDGHKNLSAALAAFAGGPARTVTESREYLGRLVYAGGDDVFAFFPLTTALGGVVELLRQYRATLRKHLTGTPLHDKDGPLATASAGIVIAHHLTPLDFVLDQVRKAEKLAKNEYGRNAVAVTTLRRSGEHATVGYQFGFDPTADVGADGGVGFGELQPVIDLSRYFAGGGSLSAKLVFDFDREAHAFGSTDMAASELRRLLLRHTNGDTLKDDGKLTTAGKGLLAGMTTLLTNANRRLVKAELRKPKRKYSDEQLAVQASQQLSGWLRVAEFIARGGEQD